jgi:hypothetical protein
MSLVFDEYGRPFVILREQQAKNRLKGIDAQKVLHGIEFVLTSLKCVAVIL